MKNAKWVILKFFLLGLWFSGCSDTAIEDATGVGNVSALTVVRGLIHEDSPSFSVLASNSTTSVTSTAKTTSQTGYLGLPMTLMTVEGVPVERREFAETTLSGGISFRFEGRFPNKPLKLRVHKQTQALDILIGKVDSSEVVLEIQDPLKEALASRMMLERETNTAIADSRDVRERVLQTASEIQIEESRRPLLEREFQRLTASRRGDQIEIDLKDTVIVDGDPPPEKNSAEPEEPQSSPAKPTPPAPPASTLRRNEVRHVSLKLENESVELYQNGTLVQGWQTIEEHKLEISIRFRDKPPSEVETSLFSDGVLKIYNSNQDLRLPLASLSPTFVSERELELTLDFADLEAGYGETLILLHESLPAFEDGVQSYLFFRLQLDRI